MDKGDSHQGIHTTDQADAHQDIHTKLKSENGRRNFFMTKSPWKNLPDMAIELGTVCMSSGHASDWATVHLKASKGDMLSMC